MTSSRWASRTKNRDDGSFAEGLSTVGRGVSAWVGLAVLICVAFLCGCEGKTYEIELIPEGKVLRRSVPAEIPGDLPGSLSYTHFGTRIGSLTVYVERFGSEYDFVDRLARARRVADGLTDFLIGWFEAELGEDPDFEKLWDFCDEELRHDITHLILTLRLAVELPEHAEKAAEELAVRACHYLAEHGYFSPEDLPLILRALVDEDTDKIMEFVQRFVADKMVIGAQGRVPARLAFLSSTERAAESLEAYLRTTEEFAKTVREWQEEKQVNPDAEEPDPFDVLPTELGVDLTLFDFDIHLFGGQDRIRVRLHCPVEPFFTNGDWDGQAGQALWSDIIEDENALSLFCYALWSLPDAEFQVGHFGKVTLAQEELAQYVLWRKGLTEEEGKEWDEFLSGLKPGEELKEKLESFRFAGSPTLADVPRELILAGLREPDAETQHEESDTGE